MMQRSWRTLIPVAILIVLIGYLYTRRNLPTVPPTATPTPASAPTSPDASRPASQQLPAFLPSEAYRTIALIKSDGRFPHRQDGEVFGNFEHLLPTEPRGYYHEYTVETLGAHDRGARRIITGGNPPAVYYYTDDHYRSFRQFAVTR